MTCDAYTCAKRAVFRTQRADRLSTESRQWCEAHFKEKVGKYGLLVTRLGGKGK